MSDHLVRGGAEEPIVPPILPRLNPKTLRLVGPDSDAIAVARIELLRRAVDVEKASRRSAELRAIDRKVDGFNHGMWFGAVIAAALIAVGKAFGWFQ